MRRNDGEGTLEARLTYAHLLRRKTLSKPTLAKAPSDVLKRKYGNFGPPDSSECALLVEIRKAEGSEPRP
jgi:hypothetical protein